MPGRLSAWGSRAWTRVRNDRRDRWFLLAVLCAFGLRLAWVVWATGSISNRFSDPAQYLAGAEAFAGLETPEIYGRPTAFLPPGYSLFLEPLHALATTGVISTNFAAALANAVLGTATVVFTALLAQRWLGERVRNVTAWIMALAAGQIYYTSVVMSETLFAALTMGTLLVLSRVFDPPARPTARVVILIGVLVGFTMLVRTPGALLLFVPPLILRARSGEWAGSLRAVGLALIGASILIVPWTIRNAVEVGVAVPVSTNNAAFLCGGHNDFATGGFDTTDEAIQYCYEDGPYDRTGNEVRWYRETSRRAFEWAFANPLEELRLTFWKTHKTLANADDALYDAEDFGNRRLTGERGRALLLSMSNGWYWAVMAFGIAGLCCVRACRRALPLWVVPLVYLVAVWAGIALTRYHHPIMPFMAIFAGAAGSLLWAARREVTW